MIELLKDWPKGEPVPALSLQQPWATAVAFYGKDIENRSRNFNYRGPLIIHASATTPHIDNFELFLKYAKQNEAPAEDLKEIRKALDKGFCPDWFPFGCLVAVVKLTDCLKAGSKIPKTHPALESPWREKGYNWLYFEDVVPTIPVQFKGAVGIFKVPYKIAVALKEVPPDGVP